MTRIVSPTPAAARDVESCLARVEHGRGMARIYHMNDDATPAGLDRPLLDAIELFGGLGLRYAVVGGLAAMMYGRARHTEDVDFILQPDHETIFAAHPDVMRKYRFDPSCTWKLYHAIGIALDIWKDEHVVAMLDRARETLWRGHRLRIVDPHDLIAMKLRANRLVDHYDISEILKHTEIDEARIENQVTEPQFARYRTIRDHDPDSD